MNISLYLNKRSIKYDNDFMVIFLRGKFLFTDEICIGLFTDEICIRLFQNNLIGVAVCVRREGRKGERRKGGEREGRTRLFIKW